MHIIISYTVHIDIMIIFVPAECIKYYNVDGKRAKNGERKQLENEKNRRWILHRYNVYMK